MSIFTEVINNLFCVVLFDRLLRKVDRVRDSFFPWLDGFWHFNKVSIYLSIYLSASLALRIRLMCSSKEMFKLPCNELTQAQYLNRRGYNLSLLNQEIQRVHTITHSHKRLTQTYPSGCRIPPRPSLNIIYFWQTHLHSLILPTLCYFV